MYKEECSHGHMTLDRSTYTDIWCSARFGSVCFFWPGVSECIGGETVGLFYDKVNTF
jgi:hypothetical protein